MKSLWLILWPHSKDAGQGFRASIKTFAIRGISGHCKGKASHLSKGWW